MLLRISMVALLLVGGLALGAEPDTSRGDRMLFDYFRSQTVKLREACLADITSLDDWQAKRKVLHAELLDMLGLDPLPAKTDLKPVVTGAVEKDDFVVEKVHFQSQPGLYVTGNLYRPREVKEPLPAILYVCGHGAVKKGNVSFGNKVHYQHHGAWFARNGYVCLTIDSLQLGEIEGIHHGTNNLGMWWWLNRGYTPAGVEAWNCVRALDYLETRPEVDKTRFGVTGRSGGGAYSWWIAAIDDRIRCAVPVAGVTDLEDHVINGCVEGHCDCMYFHNTYRWDYPAMCALVAPRPLLISNTDSDGIFPLEGVYRTFEKVRHIYRLNGAVANVGLSIGPGPHKDTQDLQVDAFRWFNVHLKQSDAPIEKVAVKYFEPEQLRVFDETLPEDQINTKIQETFVAAAAASTVPKDGEQWKSQRDNWLAQLKAKTFRAWPEQAATPILKPLCDVTADGVQLRVFDFNSDESIDLRLYVASRPGLEKPDLMVLNVLDDAGWQEFLASYRVGFEERLQGESLPEANAEAWAGEKKMFASFPWVMAYVAPRGVGPTAFTADPKKRVHVLRRFQLLGETLEGGQVYDARRAMQSLRSVAGLEKTPLWLQGQRQMAGVALYASLFEPDVVRLDLHELPASHRDGPYLWNVRRILDMPQAVALAAERSQVVLYHGDAAAWQYPQNVAETLGWDKKKLQVRKPQSP
jgi:dienelactone hydrolase